jgi:hypothetical protein
MGGASTNRSWKPQSHLSWPGEMDLRWSCLPPSLGGRDVGLLPAVNPGNLDAKFFAEADRGVVVAEPVGIGPEIELIPLGAAVEAPVRVFGDVGGKRSAFSSLGAVQRTRAAAFIAPRLLGVEAKQVENVLHSSCSSHCLKVNTWHETSFLHERMGRRPFRSLSTLEKGTGTIPPFRFSYSVASRQACGGGGPFSRATPGPRPNVRSSPPMRRGVWLA